MIACVLGTSRTGTGSTGAGSLYNDKIIACARSGDSKVAPQGVKSLRGLSPQHGELGHPYLGPAAHICLRGFFFKGAPPETPEACG